MPTTANHSLPYPANSDDVQVPLDMQQLAEAVDDAIEITSTLVGVLDAKEVANTSQNATTSSTAFTNSSYTDDADLAPVTVNFAHETRVLVKFSGLSKISGATGQAYIFLGVEASVAGGSTTSPAAEDQAVQMIDSGDSWVRIASEVIFDCPADTDVTFTPQTKRSGSASLFGVTDKKITVIPLGSPPA